MIGAVIFLIAFFGFLAATLGILTIPPGSLIHDLLGIPQSEYLILGIPAWQLINGVVNGIFYGFIIWLVYSLVSRASRRDQAPTQPVPQTVSVQAPPSEPKVEAPKEEAIPPTKAPTRIDTIEGIGPTYAQKLMDADIKTTEDLLEAGATRKGREDLAEQTGIASTLILEWVNLADLLRIKGVGEEYSDLLEEAGVDTVVELARRNPENLRAKIQEVNEAKQLVRRLPSLTEITEWINHAKTLPRKVEH